MHENARKGRVKVHYAHAYPRPHGIQHRDYIPRRYRRPSDEARELSSADLAWDWDLRGMQGILSHLKLEKELS
jgi:hypothetical protein